MKLSLTIAGVAMTAALLTTGATAASAAETTTTSDSCTFVQHLQSAFGKLPADLQADLTRLGAMEPGDERKAAAKQIRTDALAGEYGKKVQKRAEKKQALGGAVWEALPQSLKSDLTDFAAADTKAERRALGADISAEALDGSYGKAVQRIAERVQASPAWQECVAP